MKIIGALEAGGTKMVMAILNESGEILDRKTIPTRTPEETMPEIGDYFAEKKAEALGVACFGPIDVHKNSPTYGHILETPKLAWRGCDILGYLRERLHVPMAFDTDVNGSALGEYRFGAARDVDSCVYITIGTGIGIGVIAEGRPVHGALHPEGGHIIMKRMAGDDFPGVCPSHGDCFEGMAAGPALEKRFGVPAYLLKDREDVWELESWYIAQAIVNYICILSPRRIILGGGVMKQEQLFPLIRKKVPEMINGYLDFPELHDMAHYIVAPGLGDDQALLGCLHMALQEIGG